METVQQQIINLTNETDFDNALGVVFKDYIRYKLYYLRSENNRLETKWGMTFDEFEKKSPEMEDGMSFDMEQAYYQWEAIITELEHLKNKLKQWT